MNIATAGDALTPLDLSGRANKVRTGLSENAALVVLDPPNVQWLTGFTGSNGVIYLDHDQFILVTDRRYEEQGPRQLSDARSPAQVTISQDPIGEITKLASHKSIQLDPHVVSWEIYQRVAEGIEGKIISVASLKELRAQKDKGEIERIAMAATIVDQALQDVIPLLGLELSEMEIAAHLDNKIRTYGASGNAYQTIVASGVNSALPHAQPSTKRIDKGDVVIIDAGAVVEGYRSDMTRTFVVGAPTQKQQGYLTTVREAQEEAANMLKPGLACAELDRYCRERIEEAGWGDNFVHGTGHGVGLDIHESPVINSRSSDTLLPGMVVTVEPGIYFVDSCGVRWEDLYEITEFGSRQLTLSNKSPRV